MNTTSCAIIQDLLPLYADGGLSKESAELVEAHIAECGECKALLEQMRKETNIEVPTEKVTAPVNYFKKQALGTAGIVFGSILALFIIAFSVISIKYAWPVMHGFEPMRAEDLSVKAEGDTVVITPKESAFMNHLYYIYRVNDDDTVSMFVTYGDANTQYQIASNRGKKYAWIWSEYTFRRHVDKDGNLTATGFNGGCCTEGEGSIAGNNDFIWPTKVTLYGNIRDIYYVQNLDSRQIQEFNSVVRNNLEEMMDKARKSCYPEDETYYGIIPTKGFDFDSLGEAKLIWSTE